MKRLKKSSVTTKRRKATPSRRQQAKPECRVIVLSDGSIRIINNVAAARWVGVSQQTFADIVKRHYNPPKHSHAMRSPEARVKESYPELFR